MEKVLGILALALIVYVAIRQFSKKVQSTKGGNGGGEESKPQDPNYPAQG